MIPRLIENSVYQHLTSLHKVILLLGARQVGKTTLGRSAEAFKNIYSVDVALVNQDNYLDFILPD